MPLPKLHLRGQEPQTASRELGLRANWVQFGLLVLINAFVGGMVGLERTVVPLLAEQVFGVTSATLALSFIVSFGLVKAGANLITGRLADRLGRRILLIVGWLFGLPVPLLIILAPSWEWIVVANLLLGINQGLCWSTTVMMKIDLVGPRQRGLAMGLNEAAGYLAVAGAALVSGYIAAITAFRPYPFVLGIVFALAGLLLSVVFVRETQGYARLEAQLLPEQTEERGPTPSFWEVFARTSWRERTLFCVSQAGLVNNLNDGMAWGLFPFYFATRGIPLVQIGILAATYPAVWGLTQLLTGALSDHLGRKGLIACGMWMQAVGILLIIWLSGFWFFLLGVLLLGVGTAMVYPTLLAAVADVTPPSYRATAYGIYRFWRDSGYALGALLAGVIADLLSLPIALGMVGALTCFSGVIVALWMRETHVVKGQKRGE